MQISQLSFLYHQIPSFWKISHSLSVGKQQNTKLDCCYGNYVGETTLGRAGGRGECVRACVYTIRRAHEDGSVSNQQVHREQQYLCSKWNGKLDLGCRDIGQWISLARWCRLCQARSSIKVKVPHLLSLPQMDLIIRRLVCGRTKKIIRFIDVYQRRGAARETPAHAVILSNSGNPSELK